ncbi:MAG: hypothetical protein NTY47_01950 [Candidatus Omnitrophica bacterium]|nr:hypothetical protein [Candidatus Omnitrophota bacterium]
MKKAILLLILLFISLPIAYAANSSAEMDRIFRTNSDDNWTPEKAQANWNAKVIKVTPDGRGHLLVRAVINRDVDTLLTIDTGAPELFLSASIA